MLLCRLTIFKVNNDISAPIFKFAIFHRIESIGYPGTSYYCNILLTTYSFWNQVKAQCADEKSKKSEEDADGTFTGSRGPKSTLFEILQNKEQYY